VEKRKKKKEGRECKTQEIGKRNKENKKQNQKNCVKTMIKKYKINVIIKFKS